MYTIIYMQCVLQIMKAVLEVGFLQYILKYALEHLSYKV